MGSPKTSLVGSKLPTFLDLAALALIALLGWRFLRTGGVELIRAMENPTAAHAHEHHDHSEHHHH